MSGKCELCGGDMNGSPFRYHEKCPKKGSEGLAAGVKGRKVMIVFEETGGNGFNVYVSGLWRPLKGVPDDDRSPAEFWGSRMFAIVANVMKEAGAIQTVTDMPPPGSKGH